MTLVDVSEAETSDFSQYECLIIGCPTWNIGEMQSDWEGMYEELDEVDFSGKKVAYLLFSPPVTKVDQNKESLDIKSRQIQCGSCFFIRFIIIIIIIVRFCHD